MTIICSKCGESFSECDKVGRSLWCKLCWKKCRKEYNFTNRDKRSKYRKLNKDKILIQNQIYRDMNHEQITTASKKYRQENKCRINIKSRKYNKQIKMCILSHYSGGVPYCNHCGEKDIRCLSIDHIEGCGSSHRRELKINFYNWLKQNGMPDGYMVLCFNCQWVKRYINNECNRKNACDYKNVSDYQKKYQKKYQEKLKHEVLCHYSKNDPCCNVCGNIDERSLSIDHIENNGADHRRDMGIVNGSGVGMYRWLRKHNFPNNPPLQVLCMNCQWKKRLAYQLERDFLK